MFLEWMKLATMIADKLPSSNTLKCPKCGMHKIDYQYVGDDIERIGYFDIWCNSCLNGIHISRAKAPVNADMLPFSIGPKAIAERIPFFKQVIP